ncbi:hypothetical protein [Longitalea luteola]|uniref:hypothetical protein n=1 Tax=Longitalea luteola TaxID=2812563 RepID=UPI001A962FB3|nr:hypothetical protein [Longitalea luteola]
MKRTLLYVVFWVIFFVFDAGAQSIEANLPGVIPPSPTAAALARFGEIPVSYYTGVANINIPLYEVKNKDISIPISLAYHSSGIKVEEEASWVGLGWSLMSGGSITRMVRGLDDIPVAGAVIGYPDSYMPATIGSGGKYYEPADPSQVETDKMHLGEAINGREDTEPDIFIFNFNGRSGKFVFKKRSSPSMPLEPLLISQEDVDIKVSRSPQTNHYQWIVTDEKGMKYYFGTPESTTTRSGTGDREYTADQMAPEGLPSNVVSTWYLDKIVSPTGAEVSFRYYRSDLVGRGTQRILSRSQVKKHVKRINAYNGCTVPMNSFSYYSTYTVVHDVYLKEIIFPAGKIEFVLSDREDIEPVPGGEPFTYAKKVEEVLVSRAAGNNTYALLKKYIFNYTYTDLGIGYAGKRLRLLSLTESNGTTNLPPYLFAYNSLALPEKDSKAIDHWGYYNGANNRLVNETMYGDFITNGTLVPPTSVYIEQNGQTRNYAGANRNPNPDYIQAGMLTSITYPTGGSASFQYQLNEYFDQKTIVRETPTDAYLAAYGANTGVTNPIPETITVEIAYPTVFNVATMVQCFNGQKTCLIDEMEYDVARIESVDNTPYYYQGIGYLLTYDNQDQGAFQEMNVELPPGKYKFTVFADQSWHSKLMLTWKVKTPETVYNHYGPGLRTSRIISHDGISHNNDLVTDYNYSIKLSNGIVASTGKLMVAPLYEYEEEIYKTCEQSVYEIYAKSLVRSSSVIRPISNSAQGSPLGYDEVTVSKGEQGKIVYKYLNQKDVISAPEYPNVPTVGYSGNGLLNSETVYKKKSDSVYVKVKATTINYSLGNRMQVVKGMKVPAAEYANYITRIGVVPRFTNVKFYEVISEWAHPLNETVELFSQNEDNSVVQQFTQYHYENPLWHQRTGVTVVDSKQKQKTTTYKYPFDFSGTSVYDEMKLRNQVGVVVERILKAGNDHLESTRTNYDFWYNNNWANNIAGSLIVPRTVDTKVLTQPLYNTRIRYNAYDNTGNVVSVAKEKDVNKVYVWGYNDLYPVAEIVGASYTDVMAVLNPGIIQNPADDQALRNELNRLRQLFPSALITTFTYKPLLGITSQTDAANRTVYYEYDGFGRLEVVRDQEGNIIKTFKYNYKQ